MSALMSIFLLGLLDFTAFWLGLNKKGLINVARVLLSCEISVIIKGDHLKIQKSALNGMISKSVKLLKSY